MAGFLLKGLGYFFGRIGEIGCHRYLGRLGHALASPKGHTRQAEEKNGSAAFVVLFIHNGVSRYIVKYISIVKQEFSNGKHIKNGSLEPQNFMKDQVI